MDDVDEDLQILQKAFKLAELEASENKIAGGRFAVDV